MNDDLFPRHNDLSYLPPGDYKVIYDGKVLGVFPSLGEAQAFHRTLAHGGVTIQSPDLRKKMTPGEIESTMKIAREWGETNPMGIKPLSKPIIDQFGNGPVDRRYR